MTHASGSAHLRLANTDVLVGVKAELSPPLPDRPDEGMTLKYENSIQCSHDVMLFKYLNGASMADHQIFRCWTAIQNSVFEHFKCERHCLVDNGVRFVVLIIQN